MTMNMLRKWGASSFASVPTGRATESSVGGDCFAMDETPKIARLCIQPALKNLYVGAMLILAIDTALDACAAAVLDTSASDVIAQESQPMKRGHAEALMPLIARVMKASGVAFAELGRIVATAGPGSFTGLRVGLSAARGIALAAGKPVVASMSSLAASGGYYIAMDADRIVASPATLTGSIGIFAMFILVLLFRPSGLFGERA